MTAEVDQLKTPDYGSIDTPLISSLSPEDWISEIKQELASRNNELDEANDLYFSRNGFTLRALLTEDQKLKILPVRKNPEGPHNTVGLYVTLSAFRSAAKKIK